VVFDPNYRPALWPGPREAAAAMAPVLPYVDWYLCGVAEGEALLGVRGADAVVEAVPVAGVVVRVGARGAVVAAGGELSEVPPARIEDVIVDEIGAGDAFAAGFAYGLLQGWEPERCAHAANVVAAFALRGTGDWETLPRLDEVSPLL
jgi:2-dehydro-3-deoxygluconokinase